jgi:hypothetical protein
MIADDAGSIPAQSTIFSMHSNMVAAKEQD